MPSEKELMGASTTLLVLASLKEAPSYGYELLKRINEEAAGLFTWQEGTLYPLLHRLENEGLVRAHWEQVEARAAAATRGRKRKYYALTSKGRQRLTASTEQWIAFHKLVSRVTGAAGPTRKPALG